MHDIPAAKVGLCDKESCALGARGSLYLSKIMEDHANRHDSPTLTRPLGVYHPLWDPLPVKAGHLVEVDGVLHQHGTTGTGRDTVCLVVYGDTLAGSKTCRLLCVDIMYIQLSLYLHILVHSGNDMSRHKT